jgi:MSHA pilin protein MshC
MDIRIQQGFTLTELITIMVILGILAAVAVPKFVGNNAFENRAAADQAKAVLRYAQKVAVASHSSVTVNIQRVSPPAKCSTEVAAGVMTCQIPDSVSLSGTSTVVFDYLGRPVPNVATNTDVGGITITIQAETGYVH